MLANILIVAILALWTIVALVHVTRMTKHAVKTRTPMCVGCPGCGAGSGRHCHHLP